MRKPLSILMSLIIILICIKVEASNSAIPKVVFATIRNETTATDVDIDKLKTSFIVNGLNVGFFDIVDSDIPKEVLLKLADQRALSSDEKIEIKSILKNENLSNFITIEKKYTFNKKVGDKIPKEITSMIGKVYGAQYIFQFALENLQRNNCVGDILPIVTSKDKLIGSISGLLIEASSGKILWAQIGADTLSREEEFISAGLPLKDEDLKANLFEKISIDIMDRLKYELRSGRLKL